MNRLKGYIYVIISGILFGCMPLIAKILYSNGCTPLSLVFYRFLLPIPFLYLICKKINISIKVTKRELKELFLISILGYSATPILLYTSYNFIPSGLSTSLHFIYPVIVTIVSIVIYKEKLDIIKILCPLLCTIGIFLFLNDLNLIDNSYLGIIFAIASGFTYSYYMIAVERTSVGKINTYKTIFYLCLISSAALFVYNIILDTLVTTFKPIIWLALVLFSLLISVGAVYFFQRGIAIIGAQNTSILSTTEPITSVIIGITIFNEPITIKIILGIAAIILSVILLAINEKHISNEVNVKKG